MNQFIKKNGARSDGKMRVAFFLPSLEPGGTERNVVNLINNIDKQKYSLALVLGEKKGDFVKKINEDIPITSLDASSSFKLFLKLVSYFKKEEPDIFVSSFSRINIVCIMAKIFSGSRVKIVATEHAIFSFLPVIAKTPARRFFAYFFLPVIAKIIYPKADAIICVSKGIADDLLKVTHCSKTITTIYNPVISNRVYELANDHVDHQWFVNSEVPVIVAAGRLVDCKDYPTLLKAFSLVVKERPARLAILGKGPEEFKLKKLVNTWGLFKSVDFLGFQENPFKYMKRASVFTLSSLQEGFGNVIIEAMACGVPVVSTDCPAGPGEIIENGKNGILIPVGDYKFLSEAILKVLDNSSLVKNLSRNGLERAKDFSIEKSVKGYEKIFQELVN